MSWIAITSGSSGQATGEMTYSVAANSGAVRKGTITAQANGGVPVSLTIIQDGVARYSLTGVVLEAGPGARPVAGARVQILDDSGAFRITDANGAFAFSGIAAGRLLVEATKDGYQVSETELVLSNDMQLTITLGATP